MIAVDSGRWHTAAAACTSTYGEHEIDVVAAHCIETDHCFLLPANVAGRSGIQLRLYRLRMASERG